MAAPAPACLPVVQNVVMTTYIGNVLYLPAVARALRYGEYNARRFSALTFRIARPRCTALIFSSGRIVCTGAKSVAAARFGVYKYVALLRDRAHVQANVYDLTVQNVVASAALGFRVDLARMFAEHARTCSYEPGLFPGLIYRPAAHDCSRVVLLVFRSGRLVVTGGKTERAVHDAYAASLPLLRRYEATRSASPAPYARDARDEGEIARIVEDMQHDGVLPKLVVAANPI